LQRGAASIQRTDGLHHGGAADVELRRRRNDLHPLEGSAATPAGLPHHDQRPHGARLHQVPARLDHLGCAGHHLALGSALFVLFRLKLVLKFLVHGQVTIIFVVSVCLFVQSLSQPSLIRF